MARIFIFDSSGALDSAGGAINNALDGTVRRSKPVRLVHATQDFQNVSYEFLYHPAAGGQTVYWYQEYYGDKAHVGTPPNLRDDPGLQPTWPWAREQVASIGAGGVITYVNAIQTVAFAPTVAAPDVRWFPMKVYGPWVRLAVWVNAPVIVGRLQIWAHVAGYNSAYLDTITAPYAYEND